MSGFGTDLTIEKKNTLLFRKVDGSNFLRGDESEYCFSTERSTKLIGQGEFAIVLEKCEYEGNFDTKDADAGKDFGYDEFRVKFTTTDLIEKIEVIVVPNSWNDEISEDLFDTDQDPMLWIDNLSEFGRVIFESEATEKYGINFNFNFNF